MSRLDWLNLSNQIRSMRKRRKLRMRDVGRLLGVRDGSHLWQWETGVRAPSLETALKLSAALRCPVEVLFSEHFRLIQKEVKARQQRYDITIEY